MLCSGCRRLTHWGFAFSFLYLHDAALPVSFASFLYAADYYDITILPFSPISDADAAAWYVFFIMMPPLSRASFKTVLCEHISAFFPADIFIIATLMRDDAWWRLSCAAMPPPRHATPYYTLISSHILLAAWGRLPPVASIRDNTHYFHIHYAILFYCFPHYLIIFDIITPFTLSLAIIYYATPATITAFHATSLFFTPMITIYRESERYYFPFFCFHHMPFKT